MKRRGDKIVMVTAYDAPGARFAEDAGIDMVLVGDTAAMVVLGHSGTTPVSVDEMLFLTRTVSRNVHRPIVVGDLPFGSYEVSDEDAVRTAVRFVKEGGADVVKLEGAGPMVSRARAIVDAGIPVMGHVGLTPQSATMLGGFKTQGRTADAAQRIVDGAKELEDAGCCSIVLEAVPSPVAARITARAVDPDDRHRRRPRLRRSGARLPRPARPVGGPSPPLRQAVREPLRRDPRCARGVRERGAERRVPRGAAHVRDVGGGAGGVRAELVRELAWRSRLARAVPPRARRLPRLRPQLQPCTARTPMSEQQRAPAERPVDETAEDLGRRAPSRRRQVRKRSSP